MSKSDLKEKQFTISDLLTIIIVVAAMTAVLAPTLVKAGETANRADCVNSLKKLAFLLSASESVADNSLILEGPNSSGADLTPIGPFKLAAATYADTSYNPSADITLSGDVWAYTWTYTWVDACFVPDDYSNIQAALDNCPKSEIIVRDGVYTGSNNKNLNFYGNAITLRSENGPTNCIIDCEGDGRGFSFVSGEGGGTRVDGFTITNGFSAGGGPFPDGWGGGIYCSESSPRIRHCIIKDNQAANSGGGVGCYSNASPFIQNCLIIENSAQWGGGVYYNHNANPSIKNTTISGNAATGGGGIYADDHSFLYIRESIIADNSAVYGSEIELLGTSSLDIAYSNVNGGMSGVFLQPGSTLSIGEGNIIADPLFATGTLGQYYLSQVAAGQSVNSPCINARSQSAFEVGLDGHTTRTDHAADSDWVDMGYHYGPVLNQITCELPENESVLYSVPTICWEPNGGSNNIYAVDFSLSYSGLWLSTWENLHIQISDTYWEMSPELWDLIPSASYVYWRVRGADFAAQPPDVVISNEVFWFYKP